MVRLHSALTVAVLLAACGSATGVQKQTHTPARGGAAPGGEACFRSDPKNIYRRVSLCLTPAGGRTGRFTLGERQAVPDATLGRRCEGRFVRHAGRLTLNVERCQKRTVAEQRGRVYTSKSPGKGTIQVSIKTPRRLVVRTSWGEKVVLDRSGRASPTRR